MADGFRSAAALLHARSPELPVLCLRPHLVEARARAVVGTFPGDALYAVKCNESPVMLQALWRGGVRHFDTASIAELRLVRRVLPEARCHFMHPIKSPAAIAEAYHVHGVRRFVFDHGDELEKIAQATDGAQDLELFLRLAVPCQGALLALTGKFGAEPQAAVNLIRRARAQAGAVGLTFHVGSQCLDPRAYSQAIALAADVAELAGGIDMLDVGGGFPAAYRGDEPGFELFVEAITAACRAEGLDCPLQCEPGRLLVADGASVLARVEMRRDQALYLNDGTFGNLGELKCVGPHFPIRAFHDGQLLAGQMSGFDLFGPTCDSADSMPGPHLVSAGVGRGDWIEIGMMGAYSSSMSTRFNGFVSEKPALVTGDDWYRRQLPEQVAALAA